MPSNFTVGYKTDSSGSPGGYMDPSDPTSGDLRYCIAQANAVHVVGPDTITFNPIVFSGPTTITLASTLVLKDSNPLTLQGLATVPITLSGGGLVGVLQVQSGAVAIANLSMNQGSASGYGGGINNLGTLTLSNCTLANDSAIGGGGIANSGSLTLNNCTLTNDSEFSQGGGGIYNFGTLTLSNCTLANDSAALFGGGIYNAFNATGPLTLSNCTLVNNSSGFDGGGIYSLATLTLNNTIVAANGFDDIDGTVTVGNNNLIGVATNLSGISNGVNGNQIGSFNDQPGLGPLQNDGGPTQTMAVLPGSPAIGNGSVTLATAAGLTTDQRGFARVVNGQVDIGAYQTQANPFLVTTAADPSGIAGRLSLREAVNLANAYATAGDPAAISFDTTQMGTGTITLTQGQLELSVAGAAGPAGIETISGAGQVTVSGNNASRVFLVDSGVQAAFSGLAVADGNAAFGYGGGIYNFGTLTLSNCTLTNDSAPLSAGGGITNVGALTLSNCTLANDSVEFYGGGIANEGTLTLSNCTLTNDSANYGGGIDNFGALTLSNCTLTNDSATLSGGGGIINSGTLTLSNCTLTNDSSVFAGGGIANEGTLTLSNNTLTNDSASSGGGIYNFFGTFTLNNTIVAGNAASNGPDILGTVTLGNNNLIGVAAGLTGISNGTSGNQIGSFNDQPRLGPLQNNGGPTQTMALLPGSPAIGNGSVTLATAAGLTTDQRGFARVVNGAIDIGGLESQMRLTASPNPSPLGTSVTFTATLTNSAGSSTGTVTFLDGGTSLGTSTLSGGLATFSTSGLSAGSHSITASYTGDSNFISTVLAGTTQVVVLLQESALTPTATGFRFTLAFNTPVSTSQLFLYSALPSQVSQRSVSLIDPSGHNVRGSLLVSGNVVTYLLTGQTGALPNLSYDQGTLPTGTYTVILQSGGSIGFTDMSGNPINGSTSAYTTTFTITQPGLELSVPDFARGPGQPINLASDVNVGNNPPANDAGTGIPIRFYNPTSTPQAVSTLTFQIPYNPSLLTITGFAAGNDASGGTISLDTSTAGLALVGFTANPGSIPTAASGGLNSIDLLASVPTDAPYDSKELLDLQNISLNGGAIPVGDDNAIQTVTYLGDSNDGPGSGNPAASSTYNGPAATTILNLTVGQVGGFAGTPLVDPFIVGDILGVGSVGGSDATIVLEASVGQSLTTVPPIPGGGFTVNNNPGPDPTLSIPQFSAAPGATVLVPVELDKSDELNSVKLVLSYDTSRLQLMSGTNVQADVLPGSLTQGFTFNTDINPKTGTLLVQATSGTPLSGQGSGSVAVLAFQVKANAPAGAAFVDLSGGTALGGESAQGVQVNLQLSPAPGTAAGGADNGQIGVVPVRTFAFTLETPAIAKIPVQSGNTVQTPAIIRLQIVATPAGLPGADLIRALLPVKISSQVSIAPPMQPLRSAGADLNNLLPLSGQSSGSVLGHLSRVDTSADRAAYQPWFELPFSGEPPWLYPSLDIGF